MKKGTVGHQLYEKITQKIALTPISDYDDLKVIHTLEGRDVGGIEAFTGDRVEKMVISEMSLAPGMNYCNVLIKPAIHYNIPRFYLNYMEMQDQIQFDVDLYPCVDLALRQDYVDKYYELLRDLYLEEKEAPYFDWKLSAHAWMRTSTSPYFFMSGTDKKNEDKVHRLVHAYLDVWIKMWQEEGPVSAEEAEQIEYRREYLIKCLLEREPERHLLEKVFGKALTDKIGKAIV